MRREVAAGPLYRLIYCSHNAMGPSVDLAAEVRVILEVARRRNHADGVTGVLLATPSGFAQALEGPRDTVERTFERIRTDPRHDDVSVLAFTPTPRRLFALRPVAFCGDVRAEGPDALAGILADTTRGDERAMTGSDLLRLLVGLVRTEDEWDAA